MAVLMTKSWVKENMFQSIFLLGEIQDFQVGNQNTSNKVDYLNNYATNKTNKPSVIDRIETNAVLVLAEEALR